MDDLRTIRQKDLERLRNEQREDLGALRSAGVKPFLVGAPEGVADPTLAELAIRREAKSRRSGAVAQSLGAVFAHLDSRAALAVARRLRGATPATQAIVADVERDLDETEAPLLDAYVLGAYVVLIEAAELVANELVANELVANELVANELVANELVANDVLPPPVAPPPVPSLTADPPTDPPTP